MRARELTSGDWFRWNGDWRIFSRLPGETRVVEGRECVPARPLQPTANMPGGYIPAEEEVVVFREKSLRLS